MAVNLRIPPGIYVGGQTISGEAELHFPEILKDEIQEVHIKLRGTLYVKITKRKYSGNVPTEKSQFEDIELLRENISVWNRHTSNAPHSGVTLIPFQFVLPTNLLPSCDFQWGVDEIGIVGYFIEIVGVREGMFHRNRRVKVAFPVVPPDHEGARINHGLRMRVPFPMRTIEETKEIRRGIFGGYGKVTMQLILPDIPIFPLFTPIPYVLRIITLTKPMEYSASDQNPSEELFPSPPTRPHQIDCRLYRYVKLHAGNMKVNRDEHITDVGGFGKEANETGLGAEVDVKVNPRKWIPATNPDKHHEGVWLQEVTMRSSFVFNNPPGFEAEAMTLAYKILMEIEFLGIGNDLNAEIPVTFGSGLPFIPDSHASNAPPSFPQAGYPQALGLPKSYWELKGWKEDD